MRILRTISICAAAIAFVAAIVYGELISDIRIPHADQHPRFTMGVTHSMSIASYHEYMADMKKKYGERVDTTMFPATGITEVSLDGKVLESRQEKKTLEKVVGLFVIGPDDAVKMRFPFSFAANEDLPRIDRSLADWFKNFFPKAPKAWLEFSDKDWTIDRCVSLPAGLGLGSIGDVLRLREGTSCVVTWKGPQSGSMLISISRADGDPWMRPFVRRICRGITDATLRRLDPAAPDSPKYAVCVLADRPDYASTRKSLSIDVYSVGPGNALARMQR